MSVKKSISRERKASRCAARLMESVREVLAKDSCDADPLIYVADTGSSVIAGPFHNGDLVKLTQSPSRTPSQDPAPAPIVAHLHFKGDGLLFAIDADDNISELQMCLFPWPPKSRNNSQGA